MPVWNRVDPVATIAQIAGVDAYGLIALIVQRAETVRRNRHECAQLAQQAETIGALLPQVQREHPEMDRALGKLEATLREACVLVSACQGSSYFRRFLRSDKHAEQFRRLKEKIDFYLQIFPVISHIDTTRRLVSLLGGIESPTTQNILRSSSSRSGRATRSRANDDYSFERPQARTEPFAINREETAGARSHRARASSSSDNVHQLTHSTQGLIGFSLFEFSQLARATNNFTREYKIGEGGFGRVYKGQLQGLPVAIKRCFIESSPERLSDFENEIKYIPKLQHRNIVKLQGYCIQGKERILVYEYMRNKSLDKFIFGTAKSRGFSELGYIVWNNWRHSSRIVYLHLLSGLNIIHRDLKPSNILLDSEMNPKISDFGTARAGHPDKIQKGDVIAGTHGYMPPEYSKKGIFSGKTDVFSFGSLLLEILSGKRNGTSYSIGDRKSLSLHEYAWYAVFVQKALTKLLHPSLHGEAPSRVGSQIRRCAHVALLCVQEDPADRPSMWDVVLMLNGDAGAGAGLPTPKRPSRRYGSTLPFADFVQDEGERYKKTITVVMR
ncbi:hypothetical protein EJB05_06111, partial [Eragrostis curvula]